jgi:hypothetical protein
VLIAVGAIAVSHTFGLLWVDPLARFDVCSMIRGRERGGGEGRKGKR